jgi:chromosome segregation ATPase
MGNNPRFDAVLRAGEIHRLMGASYSGAPGDNSIKYAKNAIGAPGDPPKGMKKAASSPAAPSGFVTRKGPSPGKKSLKDDQDNQPFQKSSEVVKDLVAQYKQEAFARTEALRKARSDAELCADRRVKAVTKYRDDEAKAATETIGRLETMLQEKEAALDKLQSASDASLSQLEKMTKEGGESSKMVKQLEVTLAQLTSEKKSVQDELAAKIASCNKERDAAQRETDAELKKQQAEWQLKLDQALAAAKAGDVKSSKELAECTSKLEKAVEDLKTQTVRSTTLETSSYEKAKKFHAAAKAACDALSAYTKEQPVKPTPK